MGEHTGRMVGEHMARAGGLSSGPRVDTASANERQVGGNHYAGKMQHWDYVVSNSLGYFEGQITKYVTRWRKKNGLEDLHKAKHFLDKLIEEVEAGRIPRD